MSWTRRKLPGAVPDAAFVPGPVWRPWCRWGGLALLIVVGLLAVWISRRNAPSDVAAPRAVAHAAAPARPGDMPGAERSTRWQQRAEARLARGDLAGAAADYQAALDEDLRNAQIWARLGEVYLRCGQPREALIALGKARALQPLDVDLINSMGVAWYQQDRLEKARACFERVRKAQPSHTNSLFNLMLCGLANGDAVTVRSLLAEYLRLNPADPAALRELAFQEVLRGDYPRAQHLLNRALRANPDWTPLYLDAVAVAALRWRMDETREWLGEVERRTNPATALRLLREPALAGIRRAREGQALEKELAARAGAAAATYPDLLLAPKF